MEDHSSVSEHIVKMSGYVQRLNAMDCKIPDELAIDRVFHLLPPSYKAFVMNYNMQGMVKILGELFAMLKTTEVDIKKQHTVLMVNKTTNFKKSAHSKGKRPTRDGKQVSRSHKAPKPKVGVTCYYCNGDGH